MLTALKREMVKEARRGLAAAEDELRYTVIRAPFPGVVVKCYRHLGDFASAGSPVLSMYNPDVALRDRQPRGNAPARRLRRGTR